MKINPEKLTVENIQHVVEMCDSLMAYHVERCTSCDDKVLKKYHEGYSNACASILDTFETIGIIEEDSENEQPK